jgi:plasmid stabilization system protein ParE
MTSGSASPWTTSRPPIAPEVRALIEGDHLILYRVDRRDVEIVRVVHGARRLTELFGLEDEG